eukprot:8234671-Pyramimonas_sp.AAC.1
MCQSLRVCQDARRSTQEMQRTPYVRQIPLKSMAIAEKTKITRSVQILPAAIRPSNAFGRLAPQPDS